MAIEWVQVSETPATPEELVTLDQLLRTAVAHRLYTISAVGYDNQGRNATTNVFTVAISERNETVSGFVYEHPGRVAVVEMVLPKTPVPSPEEESIPATEPEPPAVEKFKQLLAEHKQK